MIDQIIRSNRRTLGLQISSDAQLIVRAPHRASMDSILRLVNDKLAWIRKHQERLRLNFEERQQRGAPAHSQEWYRAQAQMVFSERTTLMAKNAGLNYQSVRISNARTRWGSCSRSGRLNFSWRLILAPLWVVDYVIAHELAHLIHHNHSRHFWEKVGELFSNYKEARRWLRENQARLEF